jgi:HlyD family secretion protein
LPEDQRPAAREKAMGELRAKINAMLTGEQKAQYAQMVAQAGKAAAAAQTAPTAPATAQAQPARKSASAPAPSTGQFSAAAEFRARLASELQLTPAQLEKVDAIYADVRPRFMQLRDLSAEERPKARERISADVRARIGDLLTPEQKPKYAAILAEAGSRTTTRGRIYLLGEDGKAKAFNVRLGITDGTSTELIVAPNSPDAGELKEGATVIIGVNTPGTGATPARPSGPRMAF